MRQNKVLTGDERRLLEEVYRQHGHQVWRVVYVWTGGDRDVADEAVAEAFVRAASYLTVIRNPRRWLLTTAFNVAKEEFRRRRIVIAVDDLDPAGVNDPGPILGPELIPIIRSLPLTQRTVLVLRDVFGYPLSDVSAITGRSSVATRVHLHRGRIRLRELLQESDAS